MKTKRNLWPLGIVIAFALFTLGTTALIALACSRGNQDLVAADYYEQTIRYQSQMDRLSRAQNLPLKPTAAYDNATRAIRISLPREHAIAGAQGEVYLYRPSTSGLDQRLKLQLDADGFQSIDAANLRPGLWKAKVAWTVSGHDYAIEESVIVGAKNL